jgi:4-hydroxyisophthalate hydroxylase
VTAIPLKISDTPARGRETYQAGVVLVRPDQFIAWVSDDQADDRSKPTHVLQRVIVAR